MYLTGANSHFYRCTSAIYATREESSLQDIQPDELHVKMQDPSFLEEAQLIDVREPDEVYAFMFHFTAPACLAKETFVLIFCFISSQDH